VKEKKQGHGMKILLFKLNAIGDVLTVTPSIRLLHQADPSMTIDFLVGDWAAPGLQNNPYLHAITIIPMRHILHKSIQSAWIIVRLLWTV
jgi:ADP-heptose:LPS heptosyltransferase